MRILLIAFLLLGGCKTFQKPEVKAETIEEADGSVTRYFYVVYRLLDQEYSIAVSINMPKDLKVPVSYILAELTKKHKESATINFIQEIDRTSYAGFSDYKKMVKKMEAGRRI